MFSLRSLLTHCCCTQHLDLGVWQDIVWHNMCQGKLNCLMKYTAMHQQDGEEENCKLINKLSHKILKKNQLIMKEMHSSLYVCYFVVFHTTQTNDTECKHNFWLFERKLHRAHLIPCQTSVNNPIWNVGFNPVVTCLQAFYHTHTNKSKILMFYDTGYLLFCKHNSKAGLYFHSVFISRQLGESWIFFLLISYSL